MFKKLILSFIAANVFLLSTFVPSVQAANAPGPWYNQDPVSWYSKVYDETVSPPAEIFGERYTAAQVDWIIWSVITWLPTKILKPQLTSCIMQALLEGTADLTTCFQAAQANLVVPDKYYASKDASENRSLLSAVFEERPFSAITYVKDVGRKLHLVPEAKAQQEGFGFTTALDPIQQYWAISRNIAYFFFVLIIVVMAFMIMFRVKLSPQVIITVQSALPKIAVGLLLVTFSYAIAGLLIDLMYVVIGLMSVLFAQTAGGSPIQTFDLLTKGTAAPGGAPVGIFGLFFAYFLAFSLTAFVVIVSVLIAVTNTVTGVLFLLFNFISGGFILAIIIALVMFVILLIMLLWLLFKTLWTLAKAYVNIILLTIFAPFQIAIGVLIPRIGFSAWVRSFVSNLAVFVVVGLMFLLSMLFLTGAMEYSIKAFMGAEVVQQMCDLLFGGGATCQPIAQAASDRWPPLLSVSVAGDADIQLALLFLIVSFVLFTLIPKSADMIKSMITERPFAFGSGIGEGAAAVGAVGRGGRFVGLGGAQFLSSAQKDAYPGVGKATRSEQLLNAIYDSMGRVGLIRGRNR